MQKIFSLVMSILVLFCTQNVFAVKNGKALAIEVETMAKFLNTQKNLKSLFPQKIHGISEHDRNKLGNYLKKHGEDPLPHFAALGNHVTIYPKDASQPPVKMVITSLKPFAFITDRKFHSFAKLSDLIDWMPYEKNKQFSIFEIVVESAYARESMTIAAVGGVASYYALGGLSSLASEAYQNKKAELAKAEQSAYTQGQFRFSDAVTDKFAHKVCQADHVELSNGTGLKIKGFNKENVRTIQYLSDDRSIEFRYYPGDQYSAAKKRWVSCENPNKSGESCREMDFYTGEDIYNNVSVKDKAEFDKLVVDTEAKRQVKVKDLESMGKILDRSPSDDETYGDMTRKFAASLKYPKVTTWEEARKKFINERSKEIIAERAKHIKQAKDVYYGTRDIVDIISDKLDGLRPTDLEPFTEESVKKNLDCVIGSFTGGSSAGCDYASREFDATRGLFVAYANRLRPLERPKNLDAMRGYVHLTMSYEDQDKLDKTWQLEKKQYAENENKKMLAFRKEFERIFPNADKSQNEKDGNVDNFAHSWRKSYVERELLKLSKTNGKDMVFTTLNNEVHSTTSDALDFFQCCSNATCKSYYQSQQEMKRGFQRPYSDQQPNDSNGTAR
ncbi:hypothetical protein [Bdellovibrio sp. HCB337]|uniref:hypothetical protein n=1 Tax=Bdellovibrio sp. HCB337 TaxID=3394358 RepID=UPI0039A5BD60